ncbi:hypothetical protein [Amycolatopsis sp. H20-H5]|uniref:hypothetical protein n=1 Tax=Amycolatopsis sp. H20-H5 TaxID=3046309 RepID=UPI002DB6992C|nr:hypothetical protein [Amycolatopsis sp. H20-H5]MEC3974100.1 hypothetical protein [Amycolatopsis sp. H20-H5]
MTDRPGVAGITGYLRDNGWQRQPYHWRGAAIWSLGDGEVLVPARDGMGDGELRVREIVDVLAAVEQRSREEIVHDLTMPPADTQWFRVFPVGLPSGFATLRQGLQVLQGVEGALRAVTRSVVEGPRLSFRGEAPLAVERLLSQVQLGPARAGSYVLPVRVPLGETADGDELPLGRKVTAGLQAAVSALGEAPELPDVGDLLAAGISADLCKSLAELGGDEGQSAFEVRFRWANGSASPKPEATYRFPEGAGAVIRTTAEQLRQLGEADTVTVTGLVRSLRQDLSRDDDWSIEVRGDLPAAGGGRRTVWVRLPGRAAYEAAIAAQREGRPVRARGELAGRGRRTELVAGADGFEVLAG